MDTIRISSINGGQVIENGLAAWIGVETDSGPLRLTFELNALSSLPLTSLNLLASAKSVDPSASYFSIKVIEARIGEDRTSTEAMIFLLLPESKTRMAFEIPPEQLHLLKSDIEAIEARRNLPTQGRRDN